MTLQYIQVAVHTMQLTTLQHIQVSVNGDWGSYVGVVTRLWAVQPKNCGSLPSSGKAFFSS
jgi:predicted metallopeptidase